jgi:hypothetical protein
MKSQIKPLSLAVGVTVTLLTVGAFLVVLGIFDEYLDWDIFSPRTEQILRGLFGSSVALGAFGAIISVVLGIHEVVKSLRRLLGNAHPGAPEAAPEASRRTYLALFAGVLVLLVLTIATLAFANRRVEAHRLEVFKLIAQDQMDQLGPRLAREIGSLPRVCESCVTPTLLDLFRTLDGLPFCQSATLFLADPDDDTVLWRLPEGAPPFDRANTSFTFERFFIARDDDRAVKLALQGDTSWIDQKNSGPGFVWYHVVQGGPGKPRAVLLIVGNQSQSFREYQAVADSVRARNQKK